MWWLGRVGKQNIPLPRRRLKLSHRCCLKPRIAGFGDRYVATREGKKGTKKKRRRCTPHLAQSDAKRSLCYIKIVLRFDYNVPSVGKRTAVFVFAFLRSVSATFVVFRRSVIHTSLNAVTTTETTTWFTRRFFIVTYNVPSPQWQTVDVVFFTILGEKYNTIQIKFILRQGS